MPFLKWVGGKGQVISQLSNYFPLNYSNYFEPFVGGGAVFFYLNSKKSYINDINDKLMGLYSNVRDNVEELILELKKMETKYINIDNENRKLMYYEVRDEFNSIIDNDSIRKSVLMVFLNKTCFNGMYRENKAGKFNVPIGKHQNPTICDAENLRKCSEALLGATIYCGSYKDSVKNAKKGDFIYLDPPYYPINDTSSFTSYSSDGFFEKDQIELKKLFDDLNNRGCKVMMSNSYTGFILSLYKEYNQYKVYVGRSINANGKGRGKIPEIVITNYKND